MPHEMHIKIGTVEAIAELNNTPTAQAMWAALPLKAKAELWGEEIYFPIPVYTELEAGTTQVKVGDVAYWPKGNALCIFFGPTPISRKDEIRPASAVTVVGRIIGDAQLFKNVKSGAEINLSRHEESESHLT